MTRKLNDESCIKNDVCDMAVCDYELCTHRISINKNCYNCLYFVGFGDKHKWDVFGRLIVNNITMDYAGILLAALKSVEKENLTLTVNANIVESEYNELFDKCF